MEKEWRSPANRTVGFLAVGGTLVVTDAEVEFTPNAFERMFGRKPWTVLLEEVDGLETEPAAYVPTNLFSGGLRARLALVLRNGDRELFVVRSVPEAIDAIEALRTVG